MNEREEDTWCRFFYRSTCSIWERQVTFFSSLYACCPYTSSNVSFLVSLRPCTGTYCSHMGLPISHFGCLLKGLLHVVFLFLVSGASWKGSWLSACNGQTRLTCTLGLVDTLHICMHADSKFPTCKGVGGGNFLACDRVLDKLGYIINVTGMVGNVYCFINVNI
jgi:hypothetical protein